MLKEQDATLSYDEKVDKTFTITVQTLVKNTTKQLSSFRFSDAALGLYDFVEWSCKHLSWNIKKKAKIKCSCLHTLVYAHHKS